MTSADSRACREAVQHAADLAARQLEEGIRVEVVIHIAMVAHLRRFGDLTRWTSERTGLLVQAHDVLRRGSDDTQRGLVVIREWLPASGLARHVLLGLEEDGCRDVSRARVLPPWITRDMAASELYEQLRDDATPRWRATALALSLTGCEIPERVQLEEERESRVRPTWL